MKTPKREKQIERKKKKRKGTDFMDLGAAIHRL